MSQTHQDLARIFRAESGRILAALLMQTRSFDLAEEALADAVLQAAEQWPSQGAPSNQGAWLLAVARRRLIDRLRKQAHRNSETVIQNLQHTLTQDEDEMQSVDSIIPDERLRLIFTCCHPALAEDVRVPLTLKTLCGLSVREIARAFLSSEAAMQQRLTRAKRKILQAGIAYEVPQGQALHERLASVLSVVYLIYNESYNAYEGQTLSRKDLAEEAIRLARLVWNLLPRAEVAGLLSLLLLHHARFAARSSATQAFIPLQFQDRSLWNQDLIQEGTKIILAAMSQAQPDAYQLQAAISALHAISPSWEQTDWAQIQQLYARLYQINPSPVVALNQAMAVAYGGDVRTAFERLNELQSELENYQPYYAARAELAQQLGLREQAIADYERAIALSKNGAERDFLIGRKAAVCK